MRSTDKTIGPHVTHDKPYYDSLWRQTGGKEHPYFAEKTEIILRMIPQDVKTIADIGCGDGAITNVLAERYKTVGGDISLVGLRNLSSAAEPVIISANFLPFRDKSFDLVFSSELLEHLPDNIFPDAVSEIKRISRKYILITVPNNEKLRSRFTKCVDCGFEFHVYYHKRSFNLQKLIGYFDGYSVTYSTLCGALDDASFDVISYLRNKLANSYFFVAGSMCPHCGKASSPVMTTLVSRLIGRSLYITQVSLNLVLNKKPVLDWLVVLFEKDAGTARSETLG